MTSLGRSVVSMAVLVALVALTGCANLNMQAPMGRGAAVAPDSGYLYGRFTSIARRCSSRASRSSSSGSMAPGTSTSS